MPKPQLFEVNQEVTPRVGLNWTLDFTRGGIPPGPPKAGEVYRVGRHELIQGEWYITLKEIQSNTGYREDGFEPVGNLDEATHVLSKERKPEPEVASMLSLFKGLFDNL